jgi:tRNA threonylcarbamoyladenosine modification (KEOPS) complex  Pcc1 subunit
MVIGSRDNQIAFQLFSLVCITIPMSARLPAVEAFSRGDSPAASIVYSSVRAAREAGVRCSSRRRNCSILTAAAEDLSKLRPSVLSYVEHTEYHAKEDVTLRIVGDDRASFVLMEVDTSCASPIPPATLGFLHRQVVLIAYLMISSCLVLILYVQCLACVWVVSYTYSLPALKREVSSISSKWFPLPSSLSPVSSFDCEQTLASCTSDGLLMVMLHFDASLLPSAGKHTLLSSHHTDILRRCVCVIYCERTVMEMFVL